MFQPTTPLGHRRRPLSVLGAVAWVAGLALVVGLAVAGRQAPPPAATPHAPAVAAATSIASRSPAAVAPVEPNARIAVARGPMGVTVGAGGVWVVTATDLRLWRIDPDTDGVSAVIDLATVAPFVRASPPPAPGAAAFSTLAGGQSPAGHELLPLVAVGPGSVWVLGIPADDVLVRVDPGSATVFDPIRLPAAGTGVVSGPAGTWVTTDAGMLIGIDTARVRLGRVVRFGKGRVAAAAGTDATWVSSSDGRIVRLDPGGRATATIDGGGGGPIAVAGGSVWVRSDRTLIRIDERTGRSIERRDIATSGDISIAWALPSIVALDYHDAVARVAPRETWIADTGRALWICRPDRGEIWRIQAPGR